MNTANAPVLYIVGAGRSGSTLLERILGSIKGWVNVGELVAIFRRGVLLNERCGCGDSFDACPFWREVGRRAFGGWDQEHARLIMELRRVAVRQLYLPMLLVGNGERTPHWREAHEYVQTFERLYRAISDVAGAEVIVDSSKSAVQGLYLCRGHAADIRSLQLVRDPRGVAYSWSKENINRPNSSLDNETMSVYTARQSALMWNRANFWGTVLRTQTQSAVIRYEDFVKAPFPGLDRALRNLALDAPDLEHIAQHDVTLMPTHAIAGNPNFFTPRRIQLRLDDAWRRGLRPIDRYFVTACTAPVRGVLAIDQLRRRVLDGRREIE